MINTTVAAALTVALMLPLTVLADEIWGEPLTTFEDADINRDGKLDRDEYERIVIDEFRGSDLNRDGYLSYEEMDERERRFLLRKGDPEALEEKRVNELEYLRQHNKPFQHYDVNRDGVLGAGEYRGWGL